MERVLLVEPLTGYRVRLGFTDGSLREVDLERYLHGPIFEAIRSGPQVFGLVRVDKRMDTIVWPNGTDIDPDVLYGSHVPAWMEAELVPTA